MELAAGERRGERECGDHDLRLRRETTKWKEEGCQEVVDDRVSLPDCI